MNADLAELDELTEKERNPDWLKDKGEYVSHAHHTTYISLNGFFKINRELYFFLF